jgi:stage V sporulation protein B
VDAINKKKILTGALTLTAAGVITRILGFVYRIYMSNLMGAEGMGLYQLIMPVYTLAWSIACAGFNTTVSKLTAQERAKGEYGNMSLMLKQSVLITTLLGVLLTFVLYFGAEIMATYFFNDARVVMPLKILSLAFPFMAAGTCIRGYFIGLQETKIPAANQVLEQIVRMIVIYFIAGMFVPRGLEYAAAAALIAIVAEEIFSFFFVFVSYKFHRKKMKRSWGFAPTLSPMQSLILILSMALPLTGNRVAGSLLTAWENVLIPGRLQMFGLSAAEAISEFGRIQGMAVPLIFFPTAVLTALSVTIVPAVAEAAAAKDMRGISSITTKALLFASITGMGAASLFFFFAEELGLAIYNQPIGFMLQLLGIMCPFIYMQIILSGVLNGLGCQMFILRNALISSLISIGFIFFLIPHFGITAFIAGWFLSLVVVCVLEFIKIREYMELEISFANGFAKPALAAIMSGLGAKIAVGRLDLPMAMELAAGIAVLTALYMIIIFLTGCLNKEDLQRLLQPKHHRRRGRNGSA